MAIARAIDGKTKIHTGANVNGAGFAGRMDDIRIYNRVLSAGELQMLFGGVPANSSNSNDPTDNDQPSPWPTAVDQAMGDDDLL